MIEQALDDYHTIFRKPVEIFYRLDGSGSMDGNGGWTGVRDAWRTHERAAQPDEALLPWLYAIATNVLRNHQRSERRGRAAISRLDPPADAAPADEVLERMSDDERVRAALSRLAQFPQSHQDIFWLVTWEGLGYEQVAQALGCPVGTVRSRLSRVRQALRLNDEASG